MSREQILLDFIPEALDLIQDSESAILDIEKNWEDGREYDDLLINTLFRAFHTIKGSSGLLKLETIVKVTHEAETLLDILRSRSISPSPEICQILITMGDHLKKLLEKVGMEKADPELGEDSIALIELFKHEIRSLNGNVPKKQSRFEIFEDPVSEEPLADTLHLSEEYSSSKNGNGKRTEADMSVRNGKGTADLKKEIKVSNEKLDLLMDIMGELVIAESNVTQHNAIKQIRNDSLGQSLNRLRKIVLDMQEVVLSTRMIPISGVFQRMSRLIRDLQKKSMKKVLLHIEGEETQIDKSVVDLIADPIIHILRNSADHGIESTEERVLAGKTETGNIYLNARQSVNEVWIIIRDDGRGLSREKILEKAIERGLFSGDPDSLSDAEVFRMIFAPGLSTAKEVTDISGRGVGMDIVKQNIEKLGGKIDIQSVKDQGTTFILRIPLTLGIMEGTIIRIGSNFFTIQTIEIREFVSLRDKKGVPIEEGKEVFDVRGQFIPIFSINQILNHREPLKYDEKDKLMVIIEFDGKLLGIKVDEVIGNHNVVIKPLTGKMEEAKEVSGFTILGNGNVSLILDVKSIFLKLQGNEN